MFGKFLNKGLLDKQKPRKRRKKFSKTKKSIFYLTSGLCCLFVGFLVYLRVEPTLKSYKGVSSSSSIAWKVSVKPQNHSLLKPAHRKVIDAQIEKHLLTGSRDELQRLSDNILLNSEFDKVTIRRTYKDSIEVGVQIPEPVALIWADQLRYISENGAVFGSKKAETKSGFVTVKGIFDDYDGKFVFGKTNKLKISHHIRENIEQSLALIKLAKRKNIPLKTIYHNDYRGLALKLKKDIFVSLGHGPYEKKLDRLGTIISKAAQKGENLGRIELDFAGKAFIQKKSEKDVSEEKKI